MVENLAAARKQLDGQRDAVRDASRKWHKYPEGYEKDVQAKTVQNAQRHIQKLKEKHPTLRHDSDPADSWKAGDRAL